MSRRASFRFSLKFNIFANADSYSICYYIHDCTEMVFLRTEFEFALTEGIKGHCLMLQGDNVERLTILIDICVCKLM